MPKECFYCKKPTKMVYVATHTSYKYFQDEYKCLECNKITKEFTYTKSVTLGKHGFETKN